MLRSSDPWHHVVMLWMRSRKTRNKNHRRCERVLKKKSKVTDDAVKHVDVTAHKKRISGEFNPSQPLQEKKGTQALLTGFYFHYSYWQAEGKEEHEYESNAKVTSWEWSLMKMITSILFKKMANLRA